MTGNELLEYHEHVGFINAIAWSPDSRYIISACGEYGSDENRIHIWNTTTGENIYSRINLPSVVESLAWSPDGTGIVVAFEDGNIEVWSVE